MRRFWAGTFALTGLLLGAMAGTLLAPIGHALWEYNAAFVVCLLAAAAAWPWLQRRRVATLTMVFTGIPAVVTGFVMLYTRDLPYKEWTTWWHSVTSFALMLAFLVHWLHNRARLWDFSARLATRERAPGLAVACAWVGVAAGAALTWSPIARGVFTREAYLPLASWAILASVALAYAPWLAYRAPSLRARLADVRHRNAARAMIDTSLLLSHSGAIVTGFLLLYFAQPLQDGPLKYVSKWWHTATSVVFLGLVALHVGFNARALAAHARRVDEDLVPTPRP